MRFQLQNWSLWTILIIALVWTVKTTQIAKWEYGAVVSVSDVKSYYAYLPAIFIYQDASFAYVDELPEWIQEKIHYDVDEDGRRIPKMLIGTSVFYFPFFMLAHIHSGILDLPQDGYSPMYEVYLSFSSIFWAVIGLLFLRKVLLRFFSDGITALTIFILALSTNLYYYVTGEGMMSHVFSFSLSCIFLFASLKWSDRPTIKTALLIGLTGGLTVLIRPVGITLFFIPLFLFYEKARQYRTQELPLTQLYIQALLALFISGISLLPQLLFWKSGAGDYIVEPYVHERFVFESPYMIEGLFSYRKGWLLYTPVMLFAIAGFFVFDKYSKALNKSIQLYLAISIYLIFSWWCWWYGGSFGQRSMIDTYAFLSLPLGAMLTHILKSRFLIKMTGIALILLFFGLNQFQTAQFRHFYILHADGMSKELYWKIFLKTERPDNFDEILERPDYVVPER